jgi:ketosteroid isomerase-like protein
VHVRNLSLVQKAFAAFGDRDLDALLELVHPEMEFFPMTRTLAKRTEPYRGHDGMRLYFEDVATVWRELEVLPRQYSEGEDHVVVYGRVRGITADGSVYDSPADWIWKIRDGMLAWGCVYGKRDARAAFEAAAAPNGRPATTAAHA